MTAPIPGQPDPAADQPDPEGEQAPPETPEEKAARLESELAEFKKHSRTWEARAKENKDAAKRLAELEAANATPDQKLQAAVEAAAKAERELARYKVANETGLPADLIVGDDEDAMRSYADRLKQFAGAQAPKQHTPPKPDPSQGGTGGKATVSQAEIGRAAAQARAARRSGKKS